MGVNLFTEEMNSMIQIIRLTKSTIVKDSTDGEYVYYTHIDVHTPRNLHLQ